MDETAVIQYLTTALGGVDSVTVNGDTFFFYDPGQGRPVDQKMPFVTLVSGDRHDTASNLDRPGVYRLNIGVGKETYVSLFGPPPAFPKDGGVINTGHDFSVLDQLLPHPIYAAMLWVCILNPSEATFSQKIKPLLAEAYDVAAGRFEKKTPKG